MADRRPSQRVPQPPSSVTGDLGRWCQQVAGVLNAMPRMSYTSYADPNSSVTGAQGDALVNLASGVSAFWVKQLGSSNTGWTAVA